MSEPVYGNMLNVFPELIKMYEVFRMEPHTGAGYGERYDRRKVRGYWSWRKSKKVEVVSDLNVPDHQATLWAANHFLGKKVVIRQNDFVEVDNEIFRVVQNDNFTHEGGFYKCLMQRLAGPTDRQVANTGVERAVRGDY